MFDADAHSLRLLAGDYNALLEKLTNEEEPLLSFGAINKRSIGAQTVRINLDSQPTDDAIPFRITFSTNSTMNILFHSDGTLTSDDDGPSPID